MAIWRIYILLLHAKHAGWLGRPGRRLPGQWSRQEAGRQRLLCITMQLVRISTGRTIRSMSGCSPSPRCICLRLHGGEQLGPGRGHRGPPCELIQLCCTAQLIPSVILRPQGWRGAVQVGGQGSPQG